MNKILKNIDINKKDILFLIPLILVAIIFIIIINVGVLKCDSYVLTCVSHLHSDTLTLIMSIITSLSDTVAVICVILLCFIVIKNKKIPLCLSFAVIISALLNYVIKNIVARQRPIDFMIISETGYSFPSGHSGRSIVLYGFLIYICYKLIKKRWLKITTITLLGLIILSVAFSRLYFGVHYLTDVLAGLTLGYIFLYLFIKISKNYMFKDEGTK